MKKSYVIVDIETTGLSKRQHGITEIAAVRYQEGEVMEEFQSLVNPGHRIPAMITGITGITNEMVADAPCCEEILPAFFDFLGNDVFVAHNATFDHGFLSHYGESVCNIEWKSDVVCTRKLANRLLSFLPSKRLETLCHYFGVTNEQAHRAMADVKATVQVFDRFLQIFHEKHGDAELSSLLEIQSKPVGFAKKIFGVRPYTIGSSH